jgi:hypothetical protein
MKPGSPLGPLRPSISSRLRRRCSALPGHRDGLGLVVHILVALFEKKQNEGRFATKREVAHELEAHGALEREAMLARAGCVEDDLPTAGLAPQAF